MDGATGTVDGLEGRRATGAAPGGRGAAAPAPQAEAELGRPGGTRRPDPAAAPAAADLPCGDAGHAAALAPAAGQNELKERIGILLDDYRKWKSDQGHADGPHSLKSRRRCWTLGYQGFHLDVLPVIPDDDHPPTGILLTDENLFRWQHSDPIGYAAWFRARSEITRRLVEKRHASVADVPTWRTRTPLQRVVQILKWHCMITFAADLDNRPPSILITTLAGRAYDGEPDLFTAVRGVLDNMTQYVERRNDRWWVPNPAHEEENFTDKWNDYPERRKAFYR